MKKVTIQQMLVLIGKPSFELLLEGQMDYQREEVQGQVFLAAHFPFAPSDLWEYLVLRSRWLRMYISHISLQLLTKNMQFFCPETCI